MQHVETIVDATTLIHSVLKITRHIKFIFFSLASCLYLSRAKISKKACDDTGIKISLKCIGRIRITRAALLRKIKSAEDGKKIEDPARRWEICKRSAWIYELAAWPAGYRPRNPVGRSTGSSCQRGLFQFQVGWNIRVSNETISRKYCRESNIFFCF